MTTIIGSLPYPLSNGTTADAAQVQANFDQIVNSTNANAAGSGVNTDITALSALSTPLTPTQGGSSVYVGGTSTGSANAQAVASPSPTGFSLTAGRSILFLSGFNNSGATTLNVAGTGARNLFKTGPAGPVACTGGELRTGQYALATYDGTQYQLVSGSGLSAFLTSLAGLSPTTGDTIYASASNTAAILTAGAPGLILQSSSTSIPAWSAFPPLYKSGLTTARASATTFTVAAGAARNTDGGSPFLITIPTTLTKSLSAWALGTGNGALDTGAIAPGTYHIYVIRRTSDGLGDVLLSLSATAPTMPSGWVANRIVGSLLINGSSQITPYMQVANRFLLETPVLDVNVTSTGTTAVTRTLSVPTGRVLGALVNAGFNISAGGASSFGLLTPLALADVAATSSLFNISGNVQAAQTTHFNNLEVPTNTSAQIRSRCSASNVNTGLMIFTLGWVDYFGETP